MAKYIDAEKLKSEIMKLRSESTISESDDYYEYAKSRIIDIVDSLQQEQPEVDLETYIENVVNHYGLSLYEASYKTFSACDIDRIIRNAFEFGLNARKEE